MASSGEPPPLHSLSFVGDAVDAALPPHSGGRLIRTWAGTHEHTPELSVEPRSVGEVAGALQEARSSGRSLRVVGSLHSPNACVMGSAVVLSLRRLNRVLAIDARHLLVKVEAGIVISDLNTALDAAGLALDNLGSISEQTIAGLISTGTHGTGATKGAISCCVVELQIVTPGTGVTVCSADRDADLFHAALCSLGCLGVITGAVLRVVPAFDLTARSGPVLLHEALQDAPARARSAEYVRLWWFPYTPWCSEWRAEKVAPRVLRPPPPSLLSATWLWLRDSLFGFHLLQFALRVAVALPSLGLVPRINALWFEALFRRRAETTSGSVAQFNFDCLFKQHVDEWAVPLAALPAVFAELEAAIAPPGGRAAGYLTGNWAAHFPVEIRFVAGDEAWLSPSQGDASVVFAHIGIIEYRPYGVDPPRWRDYFAAFDGICARHGGRPHWAKEQFVLSGDAGFAARFPRWAQFKAMRARLDPTGVLVNPWLERMLGL